MECLVGKMNDLVGISEHLVGKTAHLVRKVTSMKLALIKRSFFTFYRLNLITYDKCKEYPNEYLFFNSNNLKI
ncbi:hypothetical protein [Psychrobacillus sp. FJAT-51614]|uniref:hypothetical protein n=1 Tax=Psychrobacillus mangrovi TaxID=3117745 RepID=UPI003013F471